jgi:hypothetical protein
METKMRKLTLDLNTLQVQSFATDEDGPLPFGTVHGRQGKPTGQQDTECSAVDACASARGCSEVVECRPTQGTNCPSAALDCPTSRECTKPRGCDPSGIVPCVSERACTEAGCPVPA